MCKPIFIKLTDSYIHTRLQKKAYFVLISIPFVPTSAGKGKGKAVPLQAWTGPEVSTKLRFPDYMTTAQNGGKVVSLTHRPPLPPHP